MIFYCLKAMHSTEMVKGCSARGVVVSLRCLEGKMMANLRKQKIHLNYSLKLI